MNTAPAAWPTTRPRGLAPAFTLIEFVLVMALLATLMAVVAPRISGSIRRQSLEQEAVRLVALTEYARGEAVSQGVPMVVWLDPQSSAFGAQAKSGFRARENRAVEYQLREEIEWDLRGTTLVAGPQVVIEMGSNGMLATHSMPEIWLVDRSGSRVGVVTTANGWGYEVVQEHEYATRMRQVRR